MPENEPDGRPEPIPLKFRNELKGVTVAQLQELAQATSTLVTEGRTQPEMVQSLVDAGWGREFSDWYVGVFASGRTVESFPPRPTVDAGRPPTLVEYPRPWTDMEPDGNWYDRQAAPYRNGSAWLWFHALCCACPGIIFALVLQSGCVTETGKANAKRLLTYSLWGLLIQFMVRVLVVSLDIATQTVSK